MHRLENTLPHALTLAADRKGRRPSASARGTDDDVAFASEILQHHEPRAWPDPRTIMQFHSRHTSSRITLVIVSRTCSACERACSISSPMWLS